MPNTKFSKDKLVEKSTSELFPQIHGHNTLKNIADYKSNTSQVFDSYFTGKKKNYLLNKISLEVGCGGRCAGINLLSSYNLKNIYAIDLSVNNVLLTNKLAKDLGISNAIITEGNALSLDFPDDSFDFVMSDGVIHHTLDTKLAFDEITRVTKPGGVIFLGIYGYGGLFGLIFPLGKYLGRLLPFKITSYLVNSTGFLRSQEYSILDWLYTPIQNFYKPKTIEKWLSDSGYIEIQQIKSNKWFFNLGILSSFLFGNAYLYYFATKKHSTF